MIIENLSETMTDQGRKRVSASVIWEDVDQPPRTLYFETAEPFGEYLHANPNAFLIAGLFPALYYGEKRLRLEGEICPELMQNIGHAMGWILHWFHPKDTDPVVLEVKTRPAERIGRRAPAAGFLFSGGIDSTCTLQGLRKLNQDWRQRRKMMRRGM